MFANRIAVDSLGNCLISGRFSGTVDFDPDTSTKNISTVGLKDGFLLQLNATGNLRWVKTFGSSKDDESAFTDFDNAGNILATGLFSDSINLNTSTNSYWIKAKGSLDVFLCKLDTS